MRFDDMPTHPHLTHPLTGEPLRAVYITKRGETVWPVMGGSQPTGEPAPTAPPATAPAPAAPQPAAPAPTAQPAAPAPAAQQPPAQQQPVTGTQQDPAGQRPNAIGSNGEDLGYPVNTPLAEMNGHQREAYWRHKARIHEDRVKGMQDYEDLKAKASQYDSLVQASQTEHERAVAEAADRGRREGAIAAGEHVVEALFRAHATNRIAEDSVNALLENLDRKRFIDPQTGAVDTDRVKALVDSIVPPAPAAAPGAAATGASAQQQPAAPAAPAAPQQSASPTRGPDFGQGQPARSGPTGLELGREIARQRFAKQQPARTAS